MVQTFFVVHVFFVFVSQKEIIYLIYSVGFILNLENRKYLSCHAGIDIQPIPTSILSIFVSKQSHRTLLSALLLLFYS